VIQKFANSERSNHHLEVRIGSSINHISKCSFVTARNVGRLSQQKEIEREGRALVDGESCKLASRCCYTKSSS
jgi:hypothetical protein